MKNKPFAIYVFLFFVIIPEYAYAYLDPASGNAIVSFFIAIFGSAVFFLKSIFYKLFTRSSTISRTKNSNAPNDLLPVIFSEGKTYWTTFRPIVNELIKQKIHFRYITLDIHDPALKIDSKYMHSKRFSKNRMGFAKIANIESPLMLSTTPNIGSEGYPLDRPPRIINLVHVFHAMVDVSCYRKGSLDFYDTVLMTGLHEKHPIRLVEKARKLKKKSLIVAGLPCLDDLNRQKFEAEKDFVKSESSSKTILIAPSWGAKGCFTEYGLEFIETLSKANYQIIIRLHPHSYIFEPDSVENWKLQTKKMANVIWDDNIFGTKAMMQADIMISDASSIRFDFAFLYEKPVITLPISQQSLSIFESDYMSQTWADSMSDKIGVIVNTDNINDIVTIVHKTITNFTPKMLSELRETFVANFGNSSVDIVAYMKQQVKLLSMSANERLLKDQLDQLRVELDTLRKQITPSKTTLSKDLPK